MARRKTIVAALALIALTGLGVAPAYASQGVENAWETCAATTARQERLDGVPKGLLGAISLAESGRWNRRKQENVAWPWTVTAGGTGRYFDSKEEAVAEVEILLTEGVRNIDVGCMQINLYYHAGAFETLSEAFDPDANAAYASEYLRRMYRATGDWSRAAGYYHSTTPERNGPYRDKVQRFWNGSRGRLANAPATRIEDGWRPPSEIDRPRTNQFNAAFRARREAARMAETAAPRGEVFTARRQAELNAWRDSRSRRVGIGHLLAMRKAELALRRKKQMSGLGFSDSAADFAAKRRRQLDDWRLRRSTAGG